MSPDCDQDLNKHSLWSEQSVVTTPSHITKSSRDILAKKDTIFPSLLQRKLHRSLKMNSILETLAFTRRLTGEQVCRNWNEMTLLNCIYHLQQRPLTKKAQCFSCAVRRTHGLWPNHKGKKLIKLQHTHLPRFWFTGLLANFTGHHNHCEKCVHCVWEESGPTGACMCHCTFLDPQHFKIVLPNPPELQLAIISVYKQRVVAWEMQIFPQVLFALLPMTKALCP